MSGSDHVCPYCKDGEVSRIQKYRLWLNKVAGYGTVLIHAVLLLSLFVFVQSFAGSPIDADLSSREHNISEIVISNEDMVQLNDRYNESLEKGFCLFGSVSNGSVQVRQMDFVNTPSNASEGSVSFACRDEIWSRRKELVLNGSYMFLGRVHTHPDTSHRLSFRDIHNFGRWSSLSVVHGVYDGEQLNFWSHDDLHDELELDVVFRD